MADIAAIKPNERTVELHHPKDESQKLGIRVSLLPLASPAMKKIKRAINDEKLRLEARGKNFKSDDIENNQHKLIFGAMTGWEWYNPTGVKGDDGFDSEAAPNWRGDFNPAFSQRTVYEIMEEAEWFVDQLAGEISDEKAFF